jgi:ankyrin repeat protein
MSVKSSEDRDYHSFGPSTISKTPMQYACELGNADVVTELLKHLDSHSKDAVLPHWACATGQAKVLSILLQHPEILANINKKDVCGNTALFLAACVKDSATVRILLHHGADVNSRSDDLANSTDEQGSKEVDQRLGRSPLQGWAHVPNRWGHTEPHSSVEDWEETGRLLIEAGCDTEATDEAGKTVLFAWTEQIHYGQGDSDRTEEFVSLLLKHGANPCATDNEGNTPLHSCRGWDLKKNIIGLFTKAGADINAIRDDGATPLITAAKLKCNDVRPYIDNGADPNLQDLEGNTALHLICRSWSFELSHVKEWLTFADPTIKNKKGETCIYNLRYGNLGDDRVTAIPLFVEKGVDLESRNRLGRTALLAACENAQPHFITGLLRYGANATVKDFQNKSCK